MNYCDDNCEYLKDGENYTKVCTRTNEALIEDRNENDYGRNVYEYRLTQECNRRKHGITLDKAIEGFYEKAKSQEYSKENYQIVKWLEELKKFKEQKEKFREFIEFMEE